MHVLYHPKLTQLARTKGSYLLLLDPDCIYSLVLFKSDNVYNFHISLLVVYAFKRLSVMFTFVCRD